MGQIIFSLGFFAVGYVILYHVVRIAVRKGFVAGCEYMMSHKSYDMKNIIKDGVREVLDENDMNEGDQQ